MAVEAAPTAPFLNTGKTRQLIRSTLVVMAAFALARVISLGQTVIIAGRFGVGPEADAYAAANRLPELIFNVFAGGALGNAFIPIFAGFLARGDREGAWRVASRVVNAVFVVTLIASAIAAVFAPWLVAEVVAPGFDAANQAQTADLMRILLVGTLIFSVSGLMMGILQSHDRFLLPALAPSMYDIGILIGIVFLLPSLGVRGVAIGAVLGAALHLGIQVPGLIRVRAQWWPGLNWRDPSLRHVVRLMLPNVVAIGLFSINFVVMGSIASRLGTGSVAALDWGWRLMQIPQTLIGTAMAIVIFPTLSALSELGDTEGKRAAFSGSARYILIATIPAAAGLALIGPALISLLERGAFDASASTLVYSTLRFFALGIIFHSLLEITASSFYADKDTLTPMAVRVLGAAINISLAFVLSGVAAVDARYFGNLAAPYLGLPRHVGAVGGLALANSIAIGVEVLILIVILRRRWHGIHENVLRTTLVKTLAATAAMAAVITLINAGWSAVGLDHGRFLFTMLQVAVLTISGIIVFVGMTLILRMEEVRTMLALIRRRRQPAG
jgi:putative peptidoglycan lipid II flippase